MLCKKSQLLITYYIKSEKASAKQKSHSTNESANRASRPLKLSKNGHCKCNGRLVGWYFIWVQASYHLTETATEQVNVPASQT
jgi:hypothetical protein